MSRDRHSGVLSDNDHQLHVLVSEDSFGTSRSGANRAMQSGRHHLVNRTLAGTLSPVVVKQRMHLRDSSPEAE